MRTVQEVFYFEKNLVKLNYLPIDSKLHLYSFVFKILRQSHYNFDWQKPLATTITFITVLEFDNEKWGYAFHCFKKINYATLKPLS
jgi:hypothetical protein